MRKFDDFEIGDIVYDLNTEHCAALYKVDWERNRGLFRVVDKDEPSCMMISPLDGICNSACGKYWTAFNRDDFVLHNNPVPERSIEEGLFEL